jgi:putative ABC transport system substrate-binding protein
MDGVVVVFDAMTFFHRAKLADLAIRNRVATIFNFRQYVEAGGLLSFGPNLRDMYRQSARHIQKILKGEAPGEIPMEQPTRFELVINLKTAKALGLQVPPTMLARADEVIE